MIAALSPVQTWLLVVPGWFGFAFIFASALGRYVRRVDERDRRMNREWIERQRRQR